jgi:hypothetical protein
MKFSQVAAMLVGAASFSSAHPERLTEESAKLELVSRGSDKCAAQIEARKASVMALFPAPDDNYTSNFYSQKSCQSTQEANSRWNPAASPS